MEEQAVTLQTYRSGVETYAALTPDTVDGSMKIWLDAGFEGLPGSCSVFELGSATGRDAVYLRAAGFMNILCSDAVEQFFPALKEAGFPAVSFNAVSDDFPHVFDVVLANAVLLHFTRSQFRDVLRKTFDGLVSGGRFLFSVKQGSGEGWTTEKMDAPRFFCYWNGESVVEELSAVGFQVPVLMEDDLWVYVVAVKP